MAERKHTKKYYFSVEGDTEHWYLKWLQDLINANEKSLYKVSIDYPIKKNPLKHAKSLVVTRRTEIYHFFDYESDDEIHVQCFRDAMDQMKKVKSLGKQITYKSGYSNFTFDLWIILHMIDCNASYVHRKQYIAAINKGYGERFQNMDEFKEEDHFKKCLKKLQLSHVIDAIESKAYPKEK